MKRSIKSFLTGILAHFTSFVYKLLHKPKNTPQNVKFGDFVFFYPLLDEECRENNMNVLNNAERPEIFFEKPLQDNFNLISFGQYSSLCDAVTRENHIEAIREMIKVIYPHKSDKDIDNEECLSVFGFANFAAKEVDRINKLFSSVHLEYSEQEKRAGIEELQFGVFGILDWYAKRMGITDQNLVFNERWVRIFQCMKNDTEEAAFNRRLQKVYENDAKRKH